MCNTVMSGPVCPPLWDKSTYRLETIVSDVSMDPVEQCAFSSWKDIYSYSLAQHVSQVSWLDSTGLETLYYRHILVLNVCLFGGPVEVLTPLWVGALNPAGSRTGLEKFPWRL